MAVGSNLPGYRHGPHLLDPVSRQVARGFVVRTAVFAAYAVAPWLAGSRPADVVARLVMAFSFGALFAMVVAVLRGEKAGRGALNRWDEAMAFNGLCLLVHVLVPVFAQAEGVGGAGLP